MKRLYAVSASASLLAAGLVLAGCDDRPYAVSPPPPPPPPQSGTYSPPSPNILDVATRNGFRMGLDEGERADSHSDHYAPRECDSYRVAPGYDPNLGPIEVYKRAFREAFLRGYDQGFYHR